MSEELTATVYDSVRIKQVIVTAYKIPTDAPEADGTLRWSSTTLILVKIEAAGKMGVGYTYAHEATAFFIQKKLVPLLGDCNVFDIPGIHNLMVTNVRNSGTCGISMMAVSAVDNALWDLKSKILELPLFKLLGQVKDAMLLYGSGGFTSYSNKMLQSQFSGWAGLGFQYLKMKVGTHPQQDLERIKAAREAAGKEPQLMIDANGAYTIKEALQKAEEAVAFNVTWFEEPVSSDNLEGLRFIRDHAPASINIAAGEYGYNLPYFEQMVRAGAVDVLQADATRCGGISGFLKAGHLAEAHQLPFSSHCAPALHLHSALSLPSFFIAEYFHDHVRIEKMLFDGIRVPRNGLLEPDPNRPGLGFEFKEQDAEKYKL